jgi:hypothetical protein
MVFRPQATNMCKGASDRTEANMFTTHRIAKGFAAALMLTLIGSAPALVKPWSDPAPIEYLQYNLMMDSSPAYQYWRPKSVVESSYHGLFDYAPGALVHVSPMVEASPLPSIGYVPYIGYDLTPYYNLAPGCPLSPVC